MGDPHVMRFFVGQSNDVIIGVTLMSIYQDFSADHNVITNWNMHACV